MDDDKITEFFIKLTGELSALNANMRNVLDKLTNHEQRLTNLEQSNVKGKDGWKDQLLMLMAKATLIALVSIGSLTGATKLIQSVLSPVEIPQVQQVQSGQVPK